MTQVISIKQQYLVCMKMQKNKILLFAFVQNTQKKDLLFMKI